MKTVSTRTRAGRVPVARVLPLALCALVVLLAAGCAENGSAKTAPEAEAATAPAESPAAEAGQGVAEGADEGSSATASEEQTPQARSLQEAVNQLFSSPEAQAAKDVPEVEDQPATRDMIEFPSPPDHEWLVDDEGRRYFVREVPKVEGQFRRVDDNHVRVRYGITIETVGETDDAFLAKTYQVSLIPMEHDEPTPEEIAAVESEYRVELPEVDRLEWHDFGAGLPRAGQWRNGFVVADMNGDGHLDIVHGPPRRGPGPPVVFLGDGAGGWQQWKGLAFPKAPYDYGDVAAPDLNGDGTSDLVVAVHLSGLMAMVQTSPGVFETWSDGLEIVPAGSAGTKTFLSRTIDTADWDGDGDLDLIALSEGPRHPKATEREEVETPVGIAIYDNQGGGTWTVGQRLGVEEELFGDSLAVGDVDGDGHPDLVAGTNAIARRELIFLARDGWEAEPVAPDSLRRGAFVWGIDTADFDGDGLDDLVLALTARQVDSWWRAVDVLLTRKTEDGLHFERVALSAGAETSATERGVAVAAGDLDGDGAQDVAVGTANGTLSLFLGDGAGGFVSEASPELAVPAEGCRVYGLHAVDLDGDGGDEIVVGTAGDRCRGGGSLRVWKSNR